jgi:hypothetical protein
MLQRKFLELSFYLFFENALRSLSLSLGMVRITSLMPRKFFKALVIISIFLCLVIFFGHFITEEWPNPAKIEQEKMIVEAMVQFLVRKKIRNPPQKI